jgi:hypothetical protein
MLTEWIYPWPEMARILSVDHQAIAADGFEKFEQLLSEIIAVGGKIPCTIKTPVALRESRP